MHCVYGLLLLCFLARTAPAAEPPAEPPIAEHYSLEYRLFPSTSRLEARAVITLRNHTTEPQTSVPFLLYRLFDVTGASAADGAPLEFDQTIERMEDNERFQVNVVRVSLPVPLPPGATTTIALHYAGPFVGATEVWPYIHDRIGVEYSLLRPDALAYPVPSSTDHLRVRPGLEFGYDLRVTVPVGQVVASGGVLEGAPESGDLATFAFRSARPTWRIDVAAGRYRMLEDPATAMRVYYLGPDSAGAALVRDGMRRATEVYTRLFGEAPRGHGYTAIEVPDGWGSQAGDGYFLQTSAAFRDPARLPELYHEIAHAWNARAKPEVQQSRWFDEAFASYFQALTLREIEGPAAFERQMDQYRRSFLRRAARDPKSRDTPIRGYAAAGLGGNSYSKGAWSLYVLHEALGEEAFRGVIRRFLADHSAEGADFRSFERTVYAVTGKRLERFFREWIDGSESSRLLAEELSAKEMGRRYTR